MAKSTVDMGGEALRARWRARLKRFERGGRTVAEFCAAEGVSAWSFYDWRRKLGVEVGKGPPRAAVVVKPKASGVDMTGFIDVGVARLAGDDERGGRAEPVVPTGIEVRIDLGGGVLLQVLRR